MSALVTTQVQELAKTFGLMEVQPEELVSVLKATAFKGQVSDAQMAALLVVANQYGLNPWTKEIYAFPDKNNGIVPVVGVDGWSRIINSHQMFDGMDFEQDDESCTCILYRKDRNHPVRVTEYMAECRRSNAGPWQSHPRRMLRHKAMIQCARLAFGFVGIYEPDEAERIADVKAIEGEYTVHQSRRADVQAAIPKDSPERESLTADLFAVADGGTADLESAWQALTKDQRKLVADRLPIFKEHAQKADQHLAEVS